MSVNSASIVPCSIRNKEEEKESLVLVFAHGQSRYYCRFF